MALENVQNEHQRLSILLALNVMPGLETNDSLLKCACAEYGHNMPNDRIKTHIHWLNEQGLVSFEEKAGYLLVKLTSRGQDVAEGTARVPGVKTPRAK